MPSQTAAPREDEAEQGGHTDGDNVIQLKGRTACEVNTADELVVAELVFNGAFSTLDASQVRH